VEHGQSVLAITSPAAGDGKTTTAINLAATLAQSPHTRVLLVDTDLRRPFVAGNLGVHEPGPGLVGAILDADLDLQAVVRPTPFRLDILPAGTPPGNPYQVLESHRVGHLLQAARATYDYVVLDTPPVLVVPDCRLMSQSVDGFLVVVAAHRTPRKLLGEALSALESSKVLGIVFNGDDRPLSGYYGRYGGYYRQGAGSKKSRWEWPWKRHAPGPGRPAPWR
jgi:capsular exopolysaccharide synthesis family protein